MGKKSSTISHFCQLFDFGANAKGNWCYDNDIIKLDDIVDSLKYLYPQYKCTMNRYYMHGITSVCPTRQIFSQGYGLIIFSFSVMRTQFWNGFI